MIFTLFIFALGILGLFIVRLEEKKKHNIMVKRGKEGEQKLYKKLKELYGDAVILRDLYIPTNFSARGSYSQIDAVVIDETGIYVFEAKNYAGDVYGKEEERYWTEYFKIKKKSYRFYNPFLQNQSHVNHLSRYLGKHKDYFISHVVFTKDIHIKAMDIKNPNKFISTLNGKFEKIVKTNLKRQKVISKSDILEIHKKLLPCTNQPKAVKKRHVRNIKNFAR